MLYYVIRDDVIHDVGD